MILDQTDFLIKNAKKTFAGLNGWVNGWRWLNYYKLTPADHINLNACELSPKELVWATHKVGSCFAAAAREPGCLSHVLDSIPWYTLVLPYKLSVLCTIYE